MEPLEHELAGRLDLDAEPLTPRSVFPDEIDMKFKLKLHGGRTVVINVDDPSRTLDVRYTVQPGAHSPGTATAGL